MPSVQCPGCKAHISVPDLINCPRCQTFMDPPFLRQCAPAAAAAARVSGYGLGAKEWLGLSVIGAAIALVGLILYRLGVHSESQVHDRKVSAALLACL